MKCDICIIGAGPAGYQGALRAAREGRKVVLVESDQVGGTCLNRGCIPGKALRTCADALVAARAAARFGVVMDSEPGLDFKRVAEYRDRVTEALVRGVASLIKARKIELIKGEGRLAGPGRVAARTARGELEIEAGHVVIATGSVPCNLPGIVIDGERVLSSEGALGMNELPASVIVIGGGVIGCEWADLMASFGVKVAVVELLPRILPGEDRSAARVVQKALASRGVVFYLEATVEDLRLSDEGVNCVLSGGQAVAGERLIVSVGRRPRVNGLDLDRARVALDNGAVKTDERGRTSAAGVWAAGDVIGAPMLAHAASHEMEVVMDNIRGRPRRFERNAIPAVVFTRPELAGVGLREDAARQKGVAVNVGRFAYAASGKARCMGETQGFAKVIAAKDDNVILGGSVLGAHAGELIAELAMAVKSKLKVGDFIEIIHAHPTLSEIVMEAAADVQGLAPHKAGSRQG